MEKDKVMKVTGVLAGICAVALGGVALESRRERDRISLSEYNLSDSRIKGNVRIAVVSDLHNREFGNYNRRLVKKIDDIKPDIIIVPGDLITGKPAYENEISIELIKTLGSKYPVYIGRGNHELRADLYRDKYGDMWDELYDKTSKYAKWLLNEKIYLEKYNIVLSGADIGNEYYRRFKTNPMPVDYMESILGSCDTDCYNIMIAHNPDYFPMYSGYGADLTLSGHVHGGIIIIPGMGGLLSPMVRFFPRYYKGLYEYDGKQMIVSAGLGNHTINFRVNNNPELICINLCGEV